MFKTSSLWLVYYGKWIYSCGVFGCLLYNPPVLRIQQLLRLRRIWRIIQVEEDLIHGGWRPSLITSFEVDIILYIIRKPNSIIVLLFIQNISKFLTCLPPCSARFQDTNGYCILRFLSKKYITSIEQYVLCILAFVPFSRSQKFSYCVFE